MSARASRTASRRWEPESGRFARDERREVGDRASTWLSVGIGAMLVFVTTGVVRLCVGMPDAVYLFAVTTALVVFTASLLGLSPRRQRR